MLSDHTGKHFKNGGPFSEALRVSHLISSILRFDNEKQCNHEPCRIRRMVNLILTYILLNTNNCAI